MTEAVIVADSTTTWEFRRCQEVFARWSPEFFLFFHFVVWPLGSTSR